jgi:glycine/D-amino acid oxidase-like deaminating enzyme
MRTELKEALYGSKNMPLWLDRPDRPQTAPCLSAKVEAELAIVGAGFTGLWAALLAKEAHPDLDVVLIEAGSVGDGASGRNGGCVSTTLTHYQSNRDLGLPEGEPEMATLGRQNAEGFLDDLKRYRMQVDYEPTGYLHVAVQADQLRALQALFALDQKSGTASVLLDREAVQKEVASPAFLAGHWDKQTRLGILHPGKLVDGLREAACKRGVSLYENSPLTQLAAADSGSDILLTSAHGQIRARKVFLATHAYPSLIPQTRRSLMAPIWEYALATEPLSEAQMASIAWSGRQCISGEENFFHYYRLTSDNRIMIGGGVPDFFLSNSGRFIDQDDPASFEGIAFYFFTIFPQLKGLRFSHRWSGAIGASRDHSLHFGQAMNDRVVWVQGYSGQGVTPCRFGARGGLALLGLGETELARLAFVQRRPVHWPPHLLRWLGANITFSALEKADRNQGKKGLWLKMLDRTGFGIKI